MNLTERKLSVVASASLLVLTAFLFVPSQILLTNTREFPFTFLDILGPLVLLVLVSFAVVAGVLIVVSGPVGVRIVSVVFALGFLLYLQANWILWDYGLLDGRDIDWSDLGYRGIVDGLVWVLVIASCVVFGRKLRHLLNWAAVLVVAIQTVNLVWSIFGTPGALSRTAIERSATDLFAFSNDRNVLIILLDTLQSDVLQQVFDEFPSDREVFDGFTFYRNSLAGYPTTVMNVPLILSGRYFLNDIDAYTFSKEISASEQTLPRFLKERGFRSHLIGSGNVFVADDQNADIHLDHLRNTKGVNFREEILLLADLAAFRSLPHFAKKQIYNDQKWFFANRFGDHELEGMPPIKNLYDLIFTREFVRTAFVDEGKPVFKYIHYWGVHPPIRLNEKLELVELPRSRDNFVTYVRSGVTILRRILTRLKELGVYDKTLIVVTGDHGAGFHHYRVDPRAGGVSKELIEDTTVESLTKSSAMAAMLVKGFDARYALRYDDRPVALGDYPASIASSLGFENEFPGVDFLNGYVNPERERFFYYYKGFRPNAEHVFDSFTEYRVKGHSWLDESWERTDRPYSAGKRTRSLYALGERIEFTRNGKYRDFAPYGFSFSGKEFTWTDRKKAGITVELPGVTEDLVCRAGLSRVFGPSQTIGIWIDGASKLEEWKYERSSSSSEIREFIIPAEVINGNKFNLEFRLPRAIYSPKDLGISDDGRRLGLGLAWLEFSEK